MSEVAIVRDGAEAARAAAELFVEACAGAVAARGRAAVALTGGSSAPPLYAELRSPRWGTRIPWNALDVFFTDERQVPEDDPRSNAGVAGRELLSRVPVAPARVHRLRGEAKDPAAEAARAASELRSVLGTPPRLDLLLLGLGPDGHVLSLFPGLPGSADRGDEELVRAVDAPVFVEPRVPRLTLTPFLLVTARMVVLHVAGEAKAAVLARALRGPEDLAGCPGQWLRKASGRVVVVADPSAASLLA